VQINFVNPVEQPLDLALWIPTQLHICRLNLPPTPILVLSKWRVDIYSIMLAQLHFALVKKILIFLQESKNIQLFLYSILSLSFKVSEVLHCKKVIFCIVVWNGCFLRVAVTMRYGFLLCMCIHTGHMCGCILALFVHVCGSWRAEFARIGAQCAVQ
jgi:hypothetical protein